MLRVALFLSLACLPVLADDPLEKYLTSDRILNFHRVEPKIQALFVKAFDALEPERPPQLGAYSFKRHFELNFGAPCEKLGYREVGFGQHFPNPAFAGGGGISHIETLEIDIPTGFEELPEAKALELLIPFLRATFPYKISHRDNIKKEHAEWLQRMRRESRRPPVFAKRCAVLIAAPAIILINFLRGFGRQSP